MGIASERRSQALMCPAMTAGPPRVLVLEKAWQILLLFTSEQPAHDMRSIRAGTGLPATTCTRIVHSLVAAGILVEQEGRYRIGLTVVRWADVAIAGLDVLDAVRPILHELRDETGETAGFFVRQGAHRVCVAFAESRRPLGRRLTLGHMLPLNVGAPGRVLLAYDEQALQALRREPLAKFTEQSIDTWPALQAALDDVRRDGYAHSTGEWSLELAGLAAPVFAGDGELVGAVALSTPASRLGPDRLAPLRDALLRAASGMSDALPARERPRTAE
jgi:DNA-binding IclR family transcriptional regulator